MIDETNLIPLDDNKNIKQKKDLRIMKIQHNLISMGFNIIMVNKIISNFNITNEEEAIDYLIKSENGMWNHPFIPSEEDVDDSKLDLFDQPKNVMSNVFSRINTIRRSNTINAKSSNINQEDDINNIVNEKNNDNNINNIKKIINNNICEICGESKEFHTIKEFNPSKNDIFEEEEKIDNINILNDINEKSNLLNEDKETNINNIKEDEVQEEEDNSQCQICMGDFENPIEIENCKHKFCEECFHSYLVDKITTNQIEQIPCPKKSCKNQNLSENFFSKFITEQEYFKYRQFRAQNEISKDSKKIFCPLCDSYADIGESDVITIDSNNPDYIKSTLKCKKGHEFCTCGRPLHEGNCYRDEKEFKDLLITEKIKKCPKCGFLIKKNKGCNHMTCGNPTCKYEFCWLCLQEAVPDHFNFGQCAGKQFYDPDSFQARLKENHPCLFCLYSFISVILIIAFIAGGIIAVPGIGLGIISFLIIFDEESDIEFKTSVKVIMYLGYLCLGFAFENLVHIAIGIVLGIAGLALAGFILDFVFELLKCILEIIFCQRRNNNGNQNNYIENNNELHENINI